MPDMSSKEVFILLLPVFCVILIDKVVSTGSIFTVPDGICPPAFDVIFVAPPLLNIDCLDHCFGMY